jgi:hypothetical protein
MRCGFQNEMAGTRIRCVSPVSSDRERGTRLALLRGMMILSTADRLPRSTPRAIDTLLQQIRSEYREMPGLKLTEPQARRLWNIDGPTCRLALTTLLDQRFLKRTPRDTYVLGAS